MMQSTWHSWLFDLGRATGLVSQRRRRQPCRWSCEAEGLESRALLSAKCVAPDAAEVSDAGRRGKQAGAAQGKAANIPNVAGNWLLTGESELITKFTNASLTLTQSGKTGKILAGTCNFTGGSIQLTGKVRPTGHVTGKCTVQFNETTLSKQRFFADFTDDFLTFSGEVNLRSIDDLINIDGLKA